MTSNSGVATATGLLVVISILVVGIANFGIVNFSSCSMTVLYNGEATMSPITNEYNVCPIEMVNGAMGDTLATISNLTSDGTSFVVTWYNSR